MSVALAFEFLAKHAKDPKTALDLARKLAAAVVEGHSPKIPLSRAVELDRILTLDEAAAMQSTSPDTLLREDAKRVARGEPSQILQLSDRRRGMRLRHALRLAEETT